MPEGTIRLRGRRMSCRLVSSVDDGDGSEGKVFRV